MSNAAVRHWRLAARPTEGGIELLGAKVPPDALDMTLRDACSALNRDGRAFVLIRLATTDRAGIEAALEHASACSARTRISLAIDSSTLARIGARRLNTTGAGLLLDDVDAETPPAALIHEALEAVRFRSDFIASAMCSLRTGCALEATLGLARNLGLATLGHETTGKSEWRPGTQFDYTSEELAEDQLAHLLPLQYLQPQSDRQRFRFSG
jgi:hypothetical protein